MVAVEQGRGQRQEPGECLGRSIAAGVRGKHVLLGITHICELEVSWHVQVVFSGAPSNQ